MDELRKLIGVLKPATVRRLAEMGIFDPRRVVAGAAALPWVIGRGASLGSLCQIQATSRPGRTAIVDRHGALTWWELDGRVNALAHAYASLGVEPGDQVALLLRNGRELCESLLAAAKTGVVAAPLNTWARSRELGAILDRARPALCVYDTRHAPQLDGVVPEGVRLVHVGPDDAALAGSLAYTDVLGTESSLPPSPMARDRGSNTVLIHTSGTTGTPKAAARSAGTAGAAALLGLLDAIPYRHDDVMYIPNPLFHALGLGVFGVGMGTGATMVLPDAFDPRRALEDMARHRATVASFVPVMLRRILDLDDPPDLDLSALRVVLVSGSALPRDLRRRAIDRFGEVLYDMYGSTEAGWIAIATPETMRIAPDSVGKPVAGVEVAILDATGDPVTGGKGEVHVRSGALFDGYASGEDSAERGGFLSTGDLGYLDADGYLHVVGRADDMVVVGGENVYPEEVEAVIAQVDGVADVAVVGTDDEEMGQVLVAFVAGTATAETIRAACEQDLPSYKVPRRIERLDEVPRTATGKILRRTLPTGSGDRER
jgi:fatty-acyl-CoA synthase